MAKSSKKSTARTSTTGSVRRGTGTRRAVAAAPTPAPAPAAKQRRKYKRLTTAQKIAKRQAELADLLREADAEKVVEAKKVERGPSARELNAIGRQARALDRAVSVLRELAVDEDRRSHRNAAIVTLTTERNTLVSAWQAGNDVRNAYDKKHGGTDLKGEVKPLEMEAEAAAAE